MSKSKAIIGIFREWKEVIAIFTSVGALIYYVSTYKAQIESDIKSKIGVDEARTLIQIENSQLIEDVRLIKSILLSKQNGK